MESTKTIDLEERVEEIDEELEDIEERQEEIIQKSIDADENNEEFDDSLEEEFDDLEGDRVELEGEKQTLSTAIESWGGAIFGIEELTFGQVQRISDEVLEESFEFNVQSQDMTGTPKEGYYQIEILRAAVVDTPSRAPSDPAEYPTTIGEYLFEKVNAFNTVGDTEMGNSSLEERKKEFKESTQNSSTEE